MDEISEKRLREVHPLLAKKIRQLAQVLYAEGIDIRVTQGLRSWNQQEDLYAQGRTKPGKTVTNARGGYSWHNFGMAVDLVPDNQSLAGFQPDWDVTHPVWKRMVTCAEALGLTCGAEWRTFPDWPHFQLTGRFLASPDDEVRQLFQQSGMIDVWDESSLAKS